MPYRDPISDKDVARSVADYSATLRDELLTAGAESQKATKRFGERTAFAVFATLLLVAGVAVLVASPPGRREGAEGIPAMVGIVAWMIHGAWSAYRAAREAEKKFWIAFGRRWAVTEICVSSIGEEAQRAIATMMAEQMKERET